MFSLHYLCLIRRLKPVVRNIRKTLGSHLNKDGYVQPVTCALGLFSFVAAIFELLVHVFKFVMQYFVFMVYLRSLARNFINVIEERAFDDLRALKTM